MRNKNLLLNFLVIGALMATTGSARAADSTDQIKKQFFDYCLGDSTDHGDRLLDDVELPKTQVNQALALAQKLNPEGSWPDTNYEGKARASWEAYDHLTRILSLTLYARRDPASKEAPVCLAAAKSALSYWEKKDYHCPNWWYNIIGVPKILGTIGILLNSDLTPDQLSYITTVVMPRAKLGSMTGQNRVWIAGNNIMDAVLTHDPVLLAKASAVIADEIQVAAPGIEGIQIDNSFHQHGPQQQFGNYGMAFCVDMTRWAVVLRDSPFALPMGKVDILRNYLLQGENWVVWKGAMDISSCGRQLSPHSPVSKAGTIAAVMATMKIVDSANADDYAAFNKRNKPGASNDLIGTQYFFRSDYLIHRTADMMVSLKMRSQRVIGGETVNSENLSGRHLADGATFFYQSGEEYSDIFPVWNWEMIPGTTCEIDNGSLSWPVKKKSKGPAAKKEPAETEPADAIPKTQPAVKEDTFRGTTFVGAVTDGANAAAAMDFVSQETATLTAKKSWFFYGNLTICLGAGITSTSPSHDNVVTTLNQSILHEFQYDPKATVGSPDHPSGASFYHVSWFEHDQLRYIFPTPTDIELTDAKLSGNWKKVFDTPGTPKNNITKPLFSLSINHGVHPQNAAYAYIVAPSSEKYESRVEILSNTKELQAVRVDKKWLAVIFWQSGKFENIQTDSPCIMCVDISSSTGQIWIADPTQKLRKITLTANGRRIEVALPQAENAGKTVKISKE